MDVSSSPFFLNPVFNANHNAPPIESVKPSTIENNVISLETMKQIDGLSQKATIDLGQKKIKRRWDGNEEERFQEGIKEFNCNWEMVAKKVQSRTAAQCKSHFQYRKERQARDERALKYIDKLLQAHKKPKISTENEAPVA
jgi:hypothetical protein